MDSTPENLEPSSPLQDLEELDTMGPLNQACLLDEQDLLFGDLSDVGTLNEPPVFILETPRYTAAEHIMVLYLLGTLTTISAIKIQLPFLSVYLTKQD